MTCIVGVETKDGVWIGGDSATVAGWTLRITGRPKVYRVGEFVIGTSGSIRVSGLLRHAFAPPAVPDDPEALEHYLVTEFVPALRKTFGDGGVEEKDKEVVGMHESSFLVAVRGRLFKVGSDYQVNHTQAGYDAAGCGCDFALGALHALSESGLPAPSRVRVALEAAQAHSIGVRAPFTIEKL